MKTVAIIVLAIILLAAGCKTFFPPSPEEATAAETGQADEAEDETGDTSSRQPTTQQTAEEAAEAVISQVAEEKKEYLEIEASAANDTNTTPEPEPAISGSLKLQESRELCPHLARKFDCDKYDLARCDFRTLAAQNKFYPDMISCRSGYDYKGENPNHKYCFIQECRPIEKDNIVKAYGGIVAYAEYIYSVDKAEGGIMTHYTLDKCGEEKKEFRTSYDCRVYKSTSKSV
jgi:hypothetical protein